MLSKPATTTALICFFLAASCYQNPYQKIGSTLHQTASMVVYFVIIPDDKWNSTSPAVIVISKDWKTATIYIRKSSIATHIIDQQSGHIRRAKHP